MSSSCTRGGHPVSAVACFRRSSSDPPPPGWSTSADGGSGDASVAVVSGTGRMSMTRPHVSTRCTVTLTVGCRAGRWTSTAVACGTSAGCPLRAATDRKTAATPPAAVRWTPPPPFRCCHGTLPRGMLLYARSSGDPLTADHGDESVGRTTHNNALRTSGDAENI